MEFSTPHFNRERQKDQEWACQFLKIGVDYNRVKKAYGIRISAEIQNRMDFFTEENRMRKITAALFLLFFSTFAFSETPRVDIPGLTDDFDYNSLIDDLIAVEQMEIDDEYSNIVEYERVIEIIEDFETYVDDLSTLSKGLYDWTSPFGEMLATSDDTSALDATADRSADISSYEIQIIQLADVDSFMSDSIYRTAQLDGATFSIIIGEETNEIEFLGGTIHQLEDIIEEVCEDTVTVRILNDTQTTSVVSIAGVQTGSDYALKFEGDLSVLEELGMISEVDAEYSKATADLSSAESEGDLAATISGGDVTLPPSSSVEIDFSDQHFEVETETKLTFRVEFEDYDYSELVEDSPAPTLPDMPELSLGNMAEVQISNVTVSGGDPFSYFFELPETPEPEFQIPYETNNTFTRVLLVEFEGGAQKTYSITEEGDYEMPLSLYSGKEVKKVSLMNENTHRQYTFSDIEFSTVENEGGFQPLNPLSEAKDAVFTVDGVQVIRSDNSIDDVLENVTLYLYDETEEEITLAIDHDYELVSQSIVNWILSYNSAMEYLYNLTTTTAHDDEFLDRDETEQIEGLFSTETTFKSLRSKLRMAAMDAYDVSLGNDYNMLSEIGIYTKEPGSFSTDSDEWTSTSMGLLNLNVDDLNDALADDFDGVEEIFAYDSDNDYIKDTGVAYTIYTKLDSATGTIGFLTTLVEKYEDKIDDTEEDIEEMEEDLEDEEERLRERFGNMASVINSTSEQSDWLENQMNGLNNSQ